MHGIITVIPILPPIGIKTRKYARELHVLSSQLAKCRVRDVTVTGGGETGMNGKGMIVELMME